MERLAKVLSLVAIPIVLAVVGGMIQQQLQDNTLRRDYVQLAVSILQEPDTVKVRPALRDWAIALLDTSAPVGLTSSAKAALRTGAVTLPPSASATSEQVRLLEQLNAPSREARLGAAQQLIESYQSAGDAAPEIVNAALGQLEGAALARLDANGIFNVLGFLSQTPARSWTDAQRQRADAALRRLDSLRTARDPRLGPRIAGLQTQLREHLSSRR